MLKLLTSCLVFVNLTVTTGAFTCYEGHIISDNLNCSGTYECDDGSDERSCYVPGGPFNNSCQAYGEYFTEDQRCDGFANCRSCFDELNCSATINRMYHRCESNGSPYCQPLVFLCDGLPDCNDGSDEKQIGFGFKCNGFPTDAQTGIRIQNSTAVPYRCIVPQQSILTTSNKFLKILSMCFNNEDDCYMYNEHGKTILNISKCWPCLDGTIIQREQVCDTVFDCADLSDECLCERQFTSEICDHLLGDNNCSSNEVPCATGNKCIDVHRICDGSNDCPNGTDEMRCKNTPDCPAAIIECLGMFGDTVNATKCNGRFECYDGEDECGSGCPDESPYCSNCSQPTNKTPELSERCDSRCKGSTLIVCDETVNCEDKIDEKFCPLLKHCVEDDPSSPVYHDHCTGDRCNFVKDCENIVDELNCSHLTHFYCDNNKTFLPTHKVFDGVFDCKDYSDECVVTSSSISSQTELIGNSIFKVALWIIMILAVVGNLIVIFKTSVDTVNANRNANASSSTTGLCFNIMLINLAMSDFLMGFYLLFIASKSVEYSGSYCQQKQIWLLSNQCVFAGVLAVVSSEMSVFMLVVMSSYRLYVVLKPFKAKYMSWRPLISIITFLWVLSILLAVIPIFPSINKILATEIVIDQPYIPESVSTRQLIDLVETANKLPGARQTIPEVTSLSVASFCQIFNNSSVVPHYCKEPSLNKFGSFGYYSTDGVCLPRYYGASNEKAFIYSFVIVMMNFVAFFYMFIAYIILYYFASHSRNHGNQGNIYSVSRAQAERSDALSRTITRIIITDFLCWIPICIMSFLSFGGVEIPGMLYPITAIFLIPINSAVNPWIYSSFLVRKIKKIPPLIRIQMQRMQGS